MHIAASYQQKLLRRLACKIFSDQFSQYRTHLPANECIQYWITHHQTQTAHTHCPLKYTALIIASIVSFESEFGCKKSLIWLSVVFSMNWLMCLMHCWRSSAKSSCSILSVNSVFIESLQYEINVQFWTKFNKTQWFSIVYRTRTPVWKYNFSTEVNSIDWFWNRLNCCSFFHLYAYSASALLVSADNNNNSLSSISVSPPAPK